MSFYVHLPFTANAAQEKNLILLARHLLIHDERLTVESAFALDAGCSTMEEGWVSRELTPPHQASVHIGPILAGPIGYGPVAGVAPLAGEDEWDIYCVRAFGLTPDTPAHEWAVGTGWKKTAPSPRGAELRMMYPLDYAVPHNWQDIMAGRSQSDYDDNGFLFDRVGLMDPRYEKPKYDVRLPPAGAPRVSLLARVRLFLSGKS
jgi:hypothetical protein